MRVFAAFQQVALLRSLKTTSISTTELWYNTADPVMNSNNTSSLFNNDKFTSPIIENGISSRLSHSLPPLPESSRRIYLLRHGETDWNAQGRIQGGGFDIPLNENGRNQACAVSSALDDIPLSVIASSDLSRASETADIVWKAHDSCQRVVNPGFREMSFGEFEGLAAHALDLDPEIKARFKTIRKEIKENSDMVYPGGGESEAQVEARAVNALRDVLEQYKDQRHIAIVSHGRTNKILLAALIATKGLGKSSKILQSNTCINVIDIDDEGRFSIQVLNYIEHVKDNVIIR